MLWLLKATDMNDTDKEITQIYPLCKFCNFPMFVYDSREISKTHTLKSFDCLNCDNGYTVTIIKPQSRKILTQSNA